MTKSDVYLLVFQAKLIRAVNACGDAEANKATAYARLQLLGGDQKAAEDAGDEVKRRLYVVKARNAAKEYEDTSAAALMLNRALEDIIASDMLKQIPVLQGVQS